MVVPVGPLLVAWTCDVLAVCGAPDMLAMEADTGAEEAADWPCVLPADEAAACVDSDCV